MSHTPEKFLRERIEELTTKSTLYPSGSWACRTLLELAGECRKAVAVFDQDPSLRDEPEGTGLFRSLWVVDELARMCWYAVRDADRGNNDRRAEADAILERARILTARAVVELPRSDMKAVVRARFAAQSELVGDAVNSLMLAVGPVLRMHADVRDPRAVALHEQAKALAVLAAELRTEHAANLDRISERLGMRP